MIISWSMGLSMNNIICCFVTELPIEFTREWNTVVRMCVSVLTVRMNFNNAILALQKSTFKKPSILHEIFQLDIHMLFIIK